MRFWGWIFLLMVLGVGFAPCAARAGEVVFADDFRGARVLRPDDDKEILYPDPEKWAFTFWPGTVWPKSYGNGTNWLEGNAESQTYLSAFLTSVRGQTVPFALRYDPFSIQADGLHIKASLLSEDQQKAYQVGGHRRFGSGILLSRFTFTYGKIRMVAKLPSARGSWPAFWLLPEARKWPPEIDVFEGMVWGPHQKELHVGYVIPKKEGKGAGKWVPLDVDPADGFHEYGLDWTQDRLVYLFDGKVVADYPTHPSLSEPMYLLVNLAVGGKWVYNELGVRPTDNKDPERLARGADLIAADYPAEMIVKSVRVETLDP